jgi:hypothetical protein
MWREVLITQLGHEVLVAVVEDDRLVEFHADALDGSSVVGNIYKGRVRSILPGMDAAFAPPSPASYTPTPTAHWRPAVGGVPSTSRKSSMRAMKSSSRSNGTPSSIRPPGSRRSLP